MKLADLVPPAVQRFFTSPPDAAPAPKAAPELSRTKGVSAGNGNAALRSILGGQIPGAWASDHAAESARYTGWHYIAVRAICLQGMQAQVNAYAPATAANKKRYGLKSTYNEQDDKGEPLPLTSDLIMLLKRPNPYQSGGNFTYRRLQQLNLTGKCLVWNVPNKVGKIVQRFVLPTAICDPRQPTRDMPRGFYIVRPDATRYAPEAGWSMMGGLASIVGVPIPAEQVQVTMWPHPTLLDDGQSPLAAGALWSDTGDMVDRARHAQMRNGPNPSLVVNAPEEFEGDAADLQRAEDAFNKKNAGAEKNGKAIFVSAGDITPYGTTPKDMDYGQSFEQIRDAELALQGVPGVMAGITDGGSYAAFYASILQGTKLTVQPQLSMLAEEDSMVLGPQFGEGIVIEMLAPQIDDPSILENQLRTDLTGRVRKRNEYRLLRGLDPIDGPVGEELVGGTAAGQGGFGLSAGDESTTGLPGVPSMGGQGAAQGGAAQPSQSGTIAQPNAGVQTELTLNGAQITAALEVLLQISAGQLADAAGVELLVSVGIPRERASSIVRAQSVIEPPEPVDTTPQDPSNGAPPEVPKSNRLRRNGHAMNGHAKDHP